MITKRKFGGMPNSAGRGDEDQLEVVGTFRLSRRLAARLKATAAIEHRSVSGQLRAMVEALPEPDGEEKAA